MRYSREIWYNLMHCKLLVGVQMFILLIVFLLLYGGKCLFFYFYFYGVQIFIILIFSFYFYRVQMLILLFFLFIFMGWKSLNGFSQNASSWAICCSADCNDQKVMIRYMIRDRGRYMIRCMIRFMIRGRGG